MKNIEDSDQISIIPSCPVESGHKDFLLKLFKECRPDLAFINGISKEIKATVILQQFNIEQQQLQQLYPEAELNIVMLHKEPVGRLYLLRGKNEVRVLALGLLEKYRCRGIGRKLMTAVIENAANRGKTVSLQVTWFNQSAYAFYEKIGFKVIENKGVSLEMQYMP
ncbi:GNAT family N-acetyltransferase [Desulfosporosinus sp. FKB]|uniref:GNAT family N-acetyltransferase n=1 Tax=Desulfosporosinus sp. FKB TaxID=1969835 RepID=UPI000B49FD34|nr:GNAT family N-acetyltransferase [Desulfosporosinus sp. FKB]